MKYYPNRSNGTENIPKFRFLMFWTKKYVDCLIWYSIPLLEELKIPEEMKVKKKVSEFGRCLCYLENCCWHYGYSII